MLEPCPSPPGESTDTVYSFLLFDEVTVLDSLYISNKNITYVISCTSLENAKSVCSVDLVPSVINESKANGLPGEAGPEGDLAGGSALLLNSCWNVK